MSPPRLFLDVPLAEGLEAALPAAAVNYLVAVLRRREGDPVRLFDDRSGEWAATLGAITRRSACVRVGERLCPRETVPDLWLCAAPLKKARLEWVVEKATELGVARLVPLLTRRGVVERPNPARLRAHMVEAAEQCGRSALPTLAEPVALPALLAAWPAGRALLFADEAGGGAMPARPGPAAILIGPEGGWDPAERAQLAAHPGATALGLGPRVLRADTAAVAAVALWMAGAGHWPPLVRRDVAG